MLLCSLWLASCGLKLGAVASCFGTASQSAVFFVCFFLFPRLTVAAFLNAIPIAENSTRIYYVFSVLILAVATF